MPFRSGDVVQLTTRYAKTCGKSKITPHIELTDRRGIVKRCNRNDVWVLWEGRMTLEQLPHRAVELAV
jgi:hypothetical protein